MTESQGYDLLIRAGRVFCADTGLDGPGAVAVSNERVAASGQHVEGTASEMLDFPDAVLLPGFVDLHAHPAPSHWKYGIDPDILMLPRGTTTILSQGDAGANNWDHYKDIMVEPASMRIRMALSAAVGGEEEEGAVFRNLEDVDIEECVRAVEGDPELIWGIAVNAAGAAMAGHDPRIVMGRVLEMAERTGKPLLYGVRWDPFDWPVDEQLALLRPGDVVTYCFHVGPEGLAPSGRVVDAVWEAKERGVKFDIGHGMSSFNFDVAETAVREGFLPDSISTDFYARHAHSSPRHDMPRTMSKLMAVGMSDADAFERATLRPAQTLGLDGEAGTLKPGSMADLAVIRWNPDATALVDVDGNERPGGCWEPVATVRAGKVIPATTPD
jgi:dihydroorotase